MTNRNDFCTGPTDGERLTKREYFAAMAMQGLITAGDYGDTKPRDAEIAVQYADYLIDALNQEAK